MTSYNPVVKNAAGGAILNVALEPRTPTGAFQSNPTLATGDVKISIDGGSFTNLGTLPVVTPAGGKNVKIVLSQAETNGDNLVILFSDASGAEWNDLLIDIGTVAANFDDLSSRLPAALVSGRMDSSVGAMATDTLTAAALAADAVAEINATVDTAISDAALATASALATAQADLDTLTGADGATLATSQPNYAPATAAALATAQADLDTITGADGVTLATTQGNYAPAKAGDAMDLVTDAVDAAALAADALAEINATVDTALADYDGPTYAELLNLTRLGLRKDSALATDLSSLITTLNADLGSGAGAFANTTDAQEAIRDRGDAAWITATGFSTHSAADVWAAATRTLTAGTNIQLPADGLDLVTAWTVAITGNITGNLSGSVGSVTGNVGGNVTGSIGSLATQAKADVNAEADTAITDAALATAAALATVDGNVDSILADTNELQTDWADGGRLDLILDARASQSSVDDLPTNSELATALAAADDAVLAAIAALNNLSAAQVNAEVVDALATDTYAEPGQGAPAATASLSAKIGYLYKAWRNKSTSAASQYSLYNDAGDTVDQKATQADDDTTFTRGEVASGP